MLKSYQRLSPLQTLGIHRTEEMLADHKPDTWLVESSRLGMVNLRLDPNSAEACQAFEAATGVALPLEATQSSFGPETLVLWLGPDEWLCITDQSGSTLTQKLDNALADHHHSVVNVSDQYATLRLSGPESRAILARLIPFDLHSDNFQPGQCLQTLAAKANIILFQVDNAPTYDVHVRRSFANYLWHALHRAGKSMTLG